MEVILKSFLAGKEMLLCDRKGDGVLTEESVADVYVFGNCKDTVVSFVLNNVSKYKLTFFLWQYHIVDLMYVN
jgi:hypothetical protein